MNNDLINKALDQAKTLQKTIGEALGKTADYTQPLLDEALAKAGTLKETLAHSAADASEFARPHLEDARSQVDDFLSLGKDALATGVARAHAQLEPLAEHIRKTVESTAAAMAKKPGSPETDADRH